MSGNMGPSRGSGRKRGLTFESRSADKGAMDSSWNSPRARRGGARRSRERGQALVEFALIAPLFLLIVVGIIQFGIGLNYWLDLNRIANQGARWAVVDTDRAATEPVLDRRRCAPPTRSRSYLESQAVSGGLKPDGHDLLPGERRRRSASRSPALVNRFQRSCRSWIWRPISFAARRRCGSSSRPPATRRSTGVSGAWAPESASADFARCEIRRESARTAPSEPHVIVRICRSSLARRRERGSHVEHVLYQGFGQGLVPRMGDRPRAGRHRPRDDPAHRLSRPLPRARRRQQRADSGARRQADDPGRHAGHDRHGQLDVRADDAAEEGSRGGRDRRSAVPHRSRGRGRRSSRASRSPPPTSRPRRARPSTRRSRGRSARSRSRSTPCTAASRSSRRATTSTSTSTTSRRARRQSGHRLFRPNVKVLAVPGAEGGAPRPPCRDA